MNAAGDSLLLQSEHFRQYNGAMEKWAREKKGEKTYPFRHVGSYLEGWAVSGGVLALSLKKRINQLVSDCALTKHWVLL